MWTLCLPHQEGPTVSLCLNITNFQRFFNKTKFKCQVVINPFGGDQMKSLFRTEKNKIIQKKTKNIKTFKKTPFIANLVDVGIGKALSAQPVTMSSVRLVALTDWLALWLPSNSLILWLPSNS